MTEISLERNTPLLVTTAVLKVVQNTMKTNDDQLMVSQDGDPAGKWMTVAPGDSVRFESNVYLMQTGWDTWVFPVFEGA